MSEKELLKKINTLEITNSKLQAKLKLARDRYRNREKQEFTSRLRHKELTSKLEMIILKLKRRLVELAPDDELIEIIDTCK